MEATSGLLGERHPDLLVGMDASDDAGVFRISADLALVQTLDFLTPIVDDPFDFGRIAAANSLSDVYAMGGRPVTAMNIVCFPSGEFPNSVLKATLAGGLEKIHEAGAVLVGGHSVTDSEYKYGLSVTGLVHPERFLTNGNVRPGHALVLTKAIGTGVLATAVKGGLADEKTMRLLVETASMLNRRAAEILLERFHPRSLTDVTGFGLAGHMLEMARASGVAIEISAGAVPLIPSALDFARMGLLPAGCHVTREFCRASCEVSEDMELALADLMFDPQTSGGLLAALPPSEAADYAAILQDNGIPAAVVGTATGGYPGGRLVISP